MAAERTDFEIAHNATSEFCGERCCWQWIDNKPCECTERIMKALVAARREGAEEMRERCARTVEISAGMIGPGGLVALPLINGIPALLRALPVSEQE